MTLQGVAVPVTGRFHCRLLRPEKVPGTKVLGFGELLDRFRFAQPLRRWSWVLMQEGRSQETTGSPQKSLASGFRANRPKEPRDWKTNR